MQCRLPMQLQSSRLGDHITSCYPPEGTCLFRSVAPLRSPFKRPHEFACNQLARVHIHNVSETLGQHTYRQSAQGSATRARHEHDITEFGW
eukprot:9228804-Pyramimonas_sp.AAC.1